METLHLSQPVRRLAELLNLPAKEAAIIFNEWFVEGERLRKRYENACNYAWALTPEYEARTETAEKVLLEHVAKRGLCAYLQTDPRGACLYVDSAPMTSSNYSSRGLCVTQ